MGTPFLHGLEVHAMLQRWGWRVLLLVARQGWLGSKRAGERTGVINSGNELLDALEPVVVAVKGRPITN